MTEEHQAELSAAYANHRENFRDKRYQSGDAIRARVHGAMAQSVVQALVESCPNAETVADVGCGDGFITSLIAECSQLTVGVEISLGNLQAARDSVTGGRTPVLVAGDACAIPLGDRSVDVAVSHHVLEHLSEFDAGLRELKRVSRQVILVAVPSPLSPLSWCILGGGNYWTHGRFGALALIRGMLRVAIAGVSGRLAVDEKKYADLAQTIPHYFFFPSRLRSQLGGDGWKVTSMRSQVEGLPWLTTRLIRQGREGGSRGYGTVFVLQRESSDV